MPLGKAPSSKTAMRMRIEPNSSPTSKGNRLDVLASVLVRSNLIKRLWDDLGSNHASPAYLASLVQILQMEWNANPQATPPEPCPVNTSPMRSLHPSSGWTQPISKIIRFVFDTLRIFKIGVPLFVPMPHRELMYK